MTQKYALGYRGEHPGGSLGADSRCTSRKWRAKAVCTRSLKRHFNKPAEIIGAVVVACSFSASDCSIHYCKIACFPPHSCDVYRLLEVLFIITCACLFCFCCSQDTVSLRHWIVQYFLCIIAIKTWLISTVRRTCFIFRDCLMDVNFLPWARMSTPLTSVCRITQFLAMWTGS